VIIIRIFRAFISRGRLKEGLFIISNFVPFFSVKYPNRTNFRAEKLSFFFLPKFAKLNPRKIFANNQIAKLNPREIFRKPEFVKLNPRETRFF